MISLVCPKCKASGDLIDNLGDGEQLYCLCCNYSWYPDACRGCGDPINIGAGTCGALECGGKPLPKVPT